MRLLKTFPFDYFLSTSVLPHLNKKQWLDVTASIDIVLSVTLAGQVFLPHCEFSNWTLHVLGMAGTLIPMAGSKQVRVRIGNVDLYSTLHFNKASCVPNMNSDYEIMVGNDISAQLPATTID